MALLTFSPVLSPNSLSSSSVLNRTTPNLVHTTRTRTRSRTRPGTKAASSSSEESHKSTKLVTFLGKGGSGKTTSAIFAAQMMSFQHYAMAGFSTCLVIHTQDPTAECLLNCKIGTSPVLCSENLSALRFETTKMLLGPLKQLKQADARLNMTQGVLEGIFGEELGVLPGMDPIFSALALERLVGFFGNVAQRNHSKDKFDIIVYDGMSSDEMLRMISAASKARSKLYLKYVRNVAEKTDFGRMAGPSLLRLVDEAMSLTNNTNLFNGNRTADIWNSVEKMLERGSSACSEPQKFGCFLMLDPNNPASISSALRYWGCTIQAGGQICGAFAITSPKMNAESEEELKNIFSPLPFAFIPHISMGSSPLDWGAITENTVGENARNLLSTTASGSSSLMSSITFDAARKSIILFMPGFDKSEIKLYQYRGGSELLVEVGDQRRVIYLPSKIQGKVGGAKFIDRSLVITMR